MRKFIVSDLHGNGTMYQSIMSFLENLSKEDEISLYINGDLIDRGSSSADMLLDIRNRIISNSFPITYLGGNHELMMYQTYQDRLLGKNTYWNEWYRDGGWITDFALEEKLANKERILEIVDFISNLDIYHKFSETINGQNIVLVHAACPLKVNDPCDLKIKGNNSLVESYVWTRKNDPFIPFECRVGSSDYFTIIGHTPVDHPYGFEYDPEENYIDIDGGCASYVLGDYYFDHTPLVEIDSNNNRLVLLTFNNNNEILYGNYLENGNISPMPKKIVDQYRMYLDKESKVLKKI